MKTKVRTTPEGLQEYTFPDEDVTIEPIEDELEEDEEDLGADEGADDDEIEVVDPTAPEDRNREPMPKEIVDELENDDLERYDAKVKERIKQLRKVWHDERRVKESASRERDEAMRAAQALAEENRRLKTRLTTGEKTLVDTTMREATLELEAAKQAYRTAYTDGDTEKVLEAQEKLSNAQLRLDRVRNYRPEFQQSEASASQATQQRPLQPPKLDQRTTEWQQKNPWFGSPDHQDMTSLAFGIDAQLQKKGYVPGSEVYFEEVDKAMHSRFPEYFGEKSAPPNTPPKRKAPATVVASNTRTRAPRKITLTTDQVAVAEFMGITPEMYAREVLKLEQQK